MYKYECKLINYSIGHPSTGWLQCNKNRNVHYTRKLEALASLFLLLGGLDSGSIWTWDRLTGGELRSCCSRFLR
jgi:hypothetical protein